ETGGEAAGVLVDDRSLIYTGDISVRVEDVARAAGQAAALATRYGGFVSGGERSMEAGDAGATMVLRVPSEHFTTAGAQLRAPGGRPGGRVGHPVRRVRERGRALDGGGRRGRHDGAAHPLGELHHRGGPARCPG